MFQIGDFIVHGGEGVCRVEEVSYQDFISGQRRLYYTLAPVYRNGKIFVPVDGDIFMRPIISYEQAQSLIQEMPTIPGEIYESRNKQQLNEHYQEYTKRHTCADWLRLIQTLSLKREHCLDQKRKLGAIEERFLHQAEEMLYGEFAVVLGIPKEDVPDYLEQSVKAANKECGYHAATQ